VVLVSAAEGKRDVSVAATQGEPERFVGDALVTVHNIAPFGLGRSGGFGLGNEPPNPGGGVSFVITVAYDRALPIWADIAVMDTEPVGWALSR
jgi:hypothetical protein